MKVSLYRCFKADHRISMEVYADGLVSALETVGIDYRAHVPHPVLERLHKNNWVMRYLRYRFYPAYAKKQQLDNCDIKHVIDHGYAHLFRSLGRGTKCVSVHDLIPYLTWQGVIKKDHQGSVYDVKKPRLNVHTLSYLSKYDHIVTVSQNTANDLSEYLGINSDLISVVPPVIAKQFMPLPIDKVSAFREKYNLERSSKWLMVSGREYYKNHQTSLSVLKELVNNTDTPIKLIKTGLPSIEFQKMVEELGLTEYVRYLYLSDPEELPLLYNTVDCLLFPSLYEGFGMPVSEALACGTPVVMSNQASLPEAGGDLAIACCPFDIDALTEAVISQLSSNVKKQTVVEGPLWVKQFREDQIAQKISNVYRAIT